jgi:hypothetical protein
MHLTELALLPEKERERLGTRAGIQSLCQCTLRVDERNAYAADRLGVLLMDRGAVCRGAGCVFTEISSVCARTCNSLGGLMRAMQVHEAAMHIPDVWIKLATKAHVELGAYKSAIVTVGYINGTCHP